MEKIDSFEWSNTREIRGFVYICGYCNSRVAPSRAYYTNKDGLSQGYIFICSNCNRPSYAFAGRSIDGREQIIYEITPSTKFGADVEGLPEDIKSLYEEGRLATSVGAYTASVLICRKILMHVAVDSGAPQKANFLDYVNYLADNNIIPKGGEGWVDEIRKKSNEANHEIVISSRSEAKTILDFTEMLLRITYEFKSKLPKPPETEV